MSDRKPRSLLVAVLLGITALAVLARFFALDADPFAIVYEHVLSDEGWYSLNARNKVLFGEWAMDDHNVALVLCPVHTLVLRWCYELFGVSFLTTRLPGAIASAVAVVLVVWRLRRSPLAAALTGALIATQPILFAYSRVAFVETLCYGLVTVSWFFASWPSRSRLALAASGAAACLATLAKPTVAFAIPMALLAAFLLGQDRSAGARSRRSGWVFLGIVVSVAAIAPLVLEYRHLLDTAVGMESNWAREPLKNVARGLAGIVLIGFRPNPTQAPVASPSLYPGLLPILTVFGITVFGLLLRRRRPGSAPMNDGMPRTIQVTWLWIACQFAFLRLLGPGQFIPRYWMSLLLPVAIVIGSSVELVRDSEGGRAPRGGAIRETLAYLALGSGLLLVIREPTFLALATTGADPLGLAFRGGFVVALALAAVACCIAAKRLDLARRLAPSDGYARLCGLSVALLLAWSIWADGHALTKTTFSMRDASRSLVEDGVEKVLVGGSANTLALETPYYAFVYRDLRAIGQGDGYLNADLERLRPTHLLRDVHGGVFGERGKAPPYFGSARLLRTLRLCPDHGKPRFEVGVFTLLPNEGE